MESSEKPRPNLARGLNRIAIALGLAWFLFCFAMGKTPGADAQRATWVGILVPIAAYAAIRTLIAVVRWIRAGFAPATPPPAR